MRIILGKNIKAKEKLTFWNQKSCTSLKTFSCFGVIVITTSLFTSCNRKDLIFDQMLTSCGKFACPAPPISALEMLPITVCSSPIFCSSTFLPPLCFITKIMIYYLYYITTNFSSILIFFIIKYLLRFCYSFVTISPINSIFSLFIICTVLISFSLVCLFSTFTSK